MPVTTTDVYKARYDGQGYHARKVRRANEREARQTIRVEEGADFCAAGSSGRICDCCEGPLVFYCGNATTADVGWLYECLDCGAAELDPWS